jgi:hypothetical protein
VLSPLLLLLTSCESCERERPYTPFGVASSQPQAAARPSASAPEEMAEPDAFVPLFSERAPEGATRWRLFGEEVEAPRGRVFQVGLRADFDGDGSREAVAWTVPAGDSSAARGELWLFPAAADAGESEPRRLVALPGFVPTGPGCTVTVDLKQTGKRTLTLDAAARCQAVLVPRAPVRAIVVVAPARSTPELSVLRVAEPAAGEELELTPSSADRDDDGRDDVAVTFKLRATGSERPASARIVFLDRAAGLSRDSREPAASLAGLASVEALRSKGKNTTKTVPDGVANLRRLYSALCAEGKVPRILDGDGAPLACGPLGSFVDRLATAEIQSALTRGSPLEALAALSRDGWYHRAMSERQRKLLIKDIEKAVPPLTVARVVTIQARPRGSPGGALLSPLAFDPDGGLLVQTADGVVRVSPDGTAEQPVETGGTETWPLELTSPAGARISGVVHACDRSELLLSTADAGGVASDPVVTPLLAARPGACAGAQPPRTAVTPIGWTARGLEALVAGSHIGSDSGRAVRGSPRSPDGQKLVTTTPLGVLVIGDGAALWRMTSAELATPTSCVVSNAARAVACLDGGRAKLLLAP